METKMLEALNERFISYEHARGTERERHARDRFYACMSFTIEVTGLDAEELEDKFCKFIGITMDEYRNVR